MANANGAGLARIRDAHRRTPSEQAALVLLADCNDPAEPGAAFALGLLPAGPNEPEPTYADLVAAITA